MAVIIENLQEKIALKDRMVEILKHAVELSLQSESFDIPAEIGILFVDNNEIRRINMEYRKIDRVTDVLSFPMVEMHEGKIVSNTGDFDMDENLILLGDIVISPEKALEQAEEYGHSFEREMTFLVTHGVFHLLGYDHDSGDDQGKMFQRQEEILTKLGLTREKK